MRQVTRPLLLASALLAVALGLTACQANGDSGSATQTNSSSDSGPNSAGAHTESNHYEITQQVGQLHLTGKAGKVRVTAGDGPISVTENLLYTDGKPTTSHDVAGSTLNLRNDGCPEQSSGNSRCQVGWEIRAPAGTNLDLVTSAGGIELSGMSGTVTARTHSGGVDGSRLTSKVLTAKTQSGGVQLEFSQVPDQVKATTQAGGVEIKLPSGASYAVHTSTEAGRPEVNVQQDPSSPHKIDASTQAGGIEVNNG